MGVYISGMEIPKCCNNCDFNVICNHANGGVCRPKRCPLVEVSVPHGRLIDADALGNFPYNMSFCEGYEADEWVANAPTVLEAEGKGDG